MCNRPSHISTHSLMHQPVLFIHSLLPLIPSSSFRPLHFLLFILSSRMNRHLACSLIQCPSHNCSCSNSTAIGAALVSPSCNRPVIACLESAAVIIAEFCKTAAAAGHLVKSQGSGLESVQSILGKHHECGLPCPSVRQLHQTWRRL